MPIEELTNFLSEKYREYCAADASRTKPFDIRIAFEDWEAELFMFGIERNLFEVVLCDCVKPGCYHSHLHYDALGAETRKNFFDKRGAGACRETVTQFAALMRLTIVYNYPLENILAESLRTEGSNRYGFDALVFNKPRGHSGVVRIAMEAKSDENGLKTLDRQIKACLKRGGHSIEDHADSERDSHKKYQALRSWRPAYLWLVCPTKQISYGVRPKSSGIVLEAIKDIPEFTS